MAILTPTTVAIALFFTVSIIYIITQRKDARPLPPGPKGLPILGNVNDMPPAGVLECYHWLKHKDLYGPISSVTLLGQTIVIINDSKIAFELLRDRSAIYSSRPSQVFCGEMVGFRHATVLLPYSDTWKTHRKNITKVTSSNISLSVFDNVQEVESIHFLLNVLESPDALFDHIRKEAGTVILKITYGYTARARGNDPLIDMAEEAMHTFSDAAVPGKWMVDAMPFLKYVPSWFPGAGFKTTGKRMATQLLQTANQPYEFVKQQMREQKHSPSVVSQCISNVDADAEMEFIHKWVALGLYLGGADTTVSSLMTFFLAMTIFPEVQKKAQEEIDRVIGIGRLPVSKDRQSLPYIEAIMKETHRWLLVVPMGAPHASTEEDTCRGYRIPKGAIIMPNNWHFTHDPAVYPEPMTFRPERYLETSTHKPEPDPRNYIFGYGRRICPGRNVADNALFITIAQTLSVFNINKFVDVSGKPEEPEVRFEAGLISHPVPYRCAIKPRSGAHEQLIRKSGQEHPWEESDAEKLENIKW